MTVISGQATFGSPGSKSLYLGVIVDDIDFYAGARSGTVETYGPLSVGHADAANQFALASKDGKAQMNTGKALIVYNSSGTKVLEFSVTGGWGTDTINFDVTAANANYSFNLVGRG